MSRREWFRVGGGRHEEWWARQTYRHLPDAIDGVTISPAQGDFVPVAANVDVPLQLTPTAPLRRRAVRGTSPLLLSSSLLLSKLFLAILVGPACSHRESGGLRESPLRSARLLTEFARLDTYLPHRRPSPHPTTRSSCESRASRPYHTSTSPAARPRSSPALSRLCPRRRWRGTRSLHLRCSVPPSALRPTSRPLINRLGGNGLLPTLDLFPLLSAPHSLAQVFQLFSRDTSAPTPYVVRCETIVHRRAHVLLVTSPLQIRNSTRIPLRLSLRPPPTSPGQQLPQAQKQEGVTAAPVTEATIEPFTTMFVPIGQVCLLTLFRCVRGSG